MKIAIIGAGAVAEIFHLPALQTIPEFKILSIVDLNQKRLDHIVKLFRLKDATTTTDVDSVLQNPEIEGILILTPPKTHRNLVLRCADAKKHIFCEKPFSMNTTEAEEMLSYAENQGIKLTVGFNFRFIPHFVETKKLIKRLGKIISGHSTFFGDVSSWPSVSGFQQSVEEGGGALEMGAHHIDLANWYCGNPISVNAVLGRIKKKSQADDYASIFIRYENGATFKVDTGWGDISRNKLELIGTKAHLETTIERNEVLFYGAKLLRQAPIVIRPKHGRPYAEELYHFYKMVKKDASPIISRVDILNVSKIVENAYLSSEKGTSISLS